MRYPFSTPLKRVECSDIALKEKTCIVFHCGESSFQDGSCGFDKYPDRIFESSF